MINIYNVGTIVVFEYVKSYDTISNLFVTFLAYLLIYLLETKRIIIEYKSKKKKNNKFIKKKKIFIYFYNVKRFSNKILLKF